MADDRRGGSAGRLAWQLVGFVLVGWGLWIAIQMFPMAVSHGWERAEQLLLLRLVVVAWHLVHWGLPLGGLAGCFLLAANRREEEAGGAWLWMSGLLSLLPPAGWAIIDWMVPILRLPQVSGQALLPWGGGIALGLVGAWLWLRYGVGWGDLLRGRLTRRTRLERNRRTDVRKLDDLLPPERKPFDPLRYADGRRGLLVGLNERRKPIHLAGKDWLLSHVLLSGRTRAGKGVAAQVLLYQAVQRGEFVVVFDPKDDEWMPHVLHEAATRAGQPYHFVDLRPGRPAQINPFRGCDEETIEAMLIGAFSLAEKGEAADFYRLADRKAAREAARFLAGGERTAGDALAAMGRIWLQSAAGFHAAMEEMADLAAVNAAAGLDIEAMARMGGCLYIVGDMGNTRVVRMQRMLMVRLMMLAKRMQAEGRERKLMTVFADEFKVHISRPFMTGLGAAAGWGMHCILAFQSLQDLADVPADLDKDSVRGAVMENCAVQLSYRIKDPETAEWLAASTGTILVDDEMRKVERNIALTETVKAERNIRQAERYLIDINMFLNLPRGCGVLIGGSKLPAFCYTSPIVVTKRAAAREIAAASAAGMSTDGALAVPSPPADDGDDESLLSGGTPPVSSPVGGGSDQAGKTTSGARAVQSEEEDFL